MKQTLVILCTLFVCNLLAQNRGNIGQPGAGASAPIFDSLGISIPSGEIVIGTGSKAPGSSDSLTWNAGLVVGAPVQFTGLSAGAADSSLYIDASGYVGKTGLSSGGGDSMGIIRPSGYLLLGQGNNLPDTSIALFYDMTGHRLGVGTNTPSTGSKLHLHEDVVPGGAITARFTNSTTGTTLFDGLYFGYGTEAFFLNYENTPLTFWTNGTKRLDIGASGTSTFSGNVILPSLTLSTWDSVLVRHPTTGEIQARLASTIAGSDSLGRNGTAGQIVFETNTKAPNSSSNLFWDNAFTRLGIGTNAPVELLTMQKSNTGNVAIQMKNSTSGTGSTDGLFYGLGPSSIGYVWNYEASHLAFGTNASERMRITSTGNVGIGTTSPAVSAKLEISSTTGALLLPRMTTTQRDALTAVNGMIIYNTTTGVINGYESGAWVDL